MTLQVDSLKIVLYPHPALRAKTKPIAQITDDVRQVAQRMLQLMHEAPGVGLAAPQVGLAWRMFVTNHTGNPEDDTVYVNPQLADFSRESHEYEEGCLSLPKITGTIRRPTVVTIRAQDLEGNLFEMTSGELPARIWQHEQDHLDGILIIDRMAPIERQANRKLLRELEESVSGR